MPDKSRRKGANGEREAARRMGAVKISRMYQPGPDLEWRGLWVEVKRRKDSWKQLYRWLEDDASIVAMRSDRKEWLVAMPLDVFLDLMEDE